MLPNSKSDIYFLNIKLQFILKQIKSWRNQCILRFQKSKCIRLYKICEKQRENIKHQFNFLTWFRSVLIRNNNMCIFDYRCYCKSSIILLWSLVVLCLFFLHKNKDIILLMDQYSLFLKTLLMFNNTLFSPILRPW